MDSLISAHWRKSSYSGNNGTNCVEVATSRNATRSDSKGNYVKAGTATRSRILIRDTTNRDGAVLDVPVEAWCRFTVSLS